MYIIPMSSSTGDELWRNYVNIFRTPDAFGAASRARGAPSARSNSLTRALRALGARLRRAPPRSEIIFGDFSFGDNYLRNALKTESTNSEIFSPTKKYASNPFRPPVQLRGAQTRRVQWCPRSEGCPATMLNRHRA